MPTAPLSVGAYGDEVLRLHALLVERGFDVPESELRRRFFGPATRQAVRGFQQSRGLVVSGTIDAGTAIALAAGASGGVAHLVSGPSVPMSARPARSRDVATDAPDSVTRHSGHRGETSQATAKGYNRTFNAIVAAMAMPPPPSAVANYLPYRIVGNQLLLSGQAPFFGSALRTGKVGDTVSIDDARAAARLTGLNLLYVAQAALGTLDRVRDVIELEGMVNCTPTFTQPTSVIDGCSDLMVEVFGAEHGKHVRSAVGQIALPFDITVEIKASFLIDDAASFATDQLRAQPTGALSSPDGEHRAPEADTSLSHHPHRPHQTDPAGGRTVAQLLLDYLALEGVTKVFGVPGGALVFLLDELKRRHDQFQFIVARHETGAAYIAHGYAVVSGELGVVLTTTGPSATNALTGAMNAQTSNCSLLTITGEVPQQYYGESFLQEGADARLDIGVIFRNAVEYSAVVSSEKNFATLFTQALRVARSQPPRAAHISLPNNIAGTRVTGDHDQPAAQIPFPRSPREYRTVPRGTDVTEVRATLRELAAATRPLIFLGNGARQALEDGRRLQRFTQLVERFALPVMTTPDAKGIFAESHALSLRNYGMCACRWPELYMGAPDAPDHFDALLVLGSSLGELATSVVASNEYSKTLIPTSSFVQVDLDQRVIGRTFPVTRGIVADVGATIDALCDSSADHRPDATHAAERWRVIADLKASTSPFADPDGRASQGYPLHPAALVRVMAEVIRDGHIFIDAGNCVGWSLNNLVIDPPLRFHSALGMGPMGFGVGAVVGGKMAAPDDICVGLVGDGAFLMHGAEISTAAQHGIAAIWVVLQDNNLSMVSQGMGELFPPRADWTRSFEIGAPDLVKFSEGLGAQAVVIARSEGPSAFSTALQNAIRNSRGNRPQVIIANIDTLAMPPFGWPTLRAPGSR